MTLDEIHFLMDWAMDQRDHPLYANLAESLYLRLLSIWLSSSERTDDPGSSTLRLKR